MKKLLIGFLLLGSFSSFAGIYKCNPGHSKTISGNYYQGSHLYDVVQESYIEVYVDGELSSTCMIPTATIEFDLGYDIPKNNETLHEMEIIFYTHLPVSVYTAFSWPSVSLNNLEELAQDDSIVRTTILPRSQYVKGFSVKTSLKGQF